MHHVVFSAAGAISCGLLVTAIAITLDAIEGLAHPPSPSDNLNSVVNRATILTSCLVHACLLYTSDAADE